MIKEAVLLQVGCRTSLQRHYSHLRQEIRSTLQHKVCKICFSFSACLQESPLRLLFLRGVAPASCGSAQTRGLICSLCAVPCKTVPARLPA